MIQTKTIYIPFTSEQFCCPRCSKSYDQSSCQPISLHCGHSLCSTCVNLANYCQICDARWILGMPYSKNILLSSMLELKNQHKECQLHSRPLELFCNDQKKPYCAECIIEAGAVPKNSIKFSAVSSKIENLKNTIEHAKTRQKESHQNFLSLLQDKEKSLKRHLDEEFDKILEPIMTLKKKLRREVDILIVSQEDSYYDTEDYSNMKILREHRLTKWKSTFSPDTELIQKLIEDTGDQMEEERKIEKIATKFETKKNLLELEAESVKNTLLSVVGEMDFSCEAIEKKLVPKQAKINSDIFMKREKRHLEEYLKAQGFRLFWREYRKDRNYIQLQIWGREKRQIPQNHLNDHLYCLLEYLEVECSILSLEDFQHFCLILEKLDKLSSLIFTNHESNNFHTTEFCQSLSALKHLETLQISLEANRLGALNLYELWATISCLPKLRNLKLDLNLCLNFSNFVEKSFGNFKTLKQADLSFSKNTFHPNDNIAYLWTSLQKSENLSKLRYYFNDCSSHFKIAFTDFIENLPKLQHLQDLSLGFTETSNYLGREQFTPLSQALNQLPRLATLSLSITQNESRLGDILSGIDGTKLTRLEALRLDFSENKWFDGQELGFMGQRLVKLTSLKKFMLDVKKSRVSEEGIQKFISSSLSQLKMLQTVIIDCQNCQSINEGSKLKALEALNKCENIKEKHLIFNSEQMKTLAQRLVSQNSNEEMSSFDDYLQSIC